MDVDLDVDLGDRPISDVGTTCIVDISAFDSEICLERLPMAR